MGALGLASQNPSLNVTDDPLLRLARRTLAEAHLEHPEQPDDGIERVVTLREAALNFLPEPILNRDLLGISLAKQGCLDFFLVVLVALAAERVLAESFAML
jgi:hypothetical protein